MQSRQNLGWTLWLKRGKEDQFDDAAHKAQHDDPNQHPHLPLHRRLQAVETPVNAVKVLVNAIKAFIDPRKALIDALSEMLDVLRKNRHILPDACNLFFQLAPQLQQVRSVLFFADVFFGHVIPPASL